MILNPNYLEDITYYREVFAKINEEFAESVTLVVFGYDGKPDNEELFAGINYEYVKKASIVHYFKQLKHLDLDVVFIPLINNKYNATSENYNKYLECACFSIPVIVCDIFPYNAIIKNGINGLIYKEKMDVVNMLDDMQQRPLILKDMGANAYKDLVENYNYTVKNISHLISIFE